MRYLREVAFEMRSRGLGERAIGAELARMAAVNDPAGAFGPARAVAETFEAGRPRGVGKVLILTGGAAMVLGVALQIVGWAAWHQDLRVGPFPAFAASLPVLGLAIAVSIVADHRLPRCFTRRQRW